MKPVLQSRTPAQLLSIIAASNALTSLGFGMLSLRPWLLHQEHQHMPFSQTLPWVAVLMVGLTTTLFSELALKDGATSERWPDVILAPTRRLLERPGVTVLSISLLVAGIAVAAFTSASNVAAMWVFLAPALSLNRVRSSLCFRNKEATNSVPSFPVKPLQSEQWGVPPKPFSN